MCPDIAKSPQGEKGIAPDEGPVVSVYTMSSLLDYKDLEGRGPV